MEWPCNLEQRFIPQSGSRRRSRAPARRVADTGAVHATTGAEQCDLEKGLADLRPGVQMKYVRIEALFSEYPLRRVCRLLDVATTPSTLSVPLSTIVHLLTSRTPLMFIPPTISMPERMLHPLLPESCCFLSVRVSVIRLQKRENSRMKRKEHLRRLSNLFRCLDASNRVQ